MKRSAALVLLSLACGVRPATSETWSVPGLANAPGRNGTFFVSELKLRNSGASAATVTFDLLPVVGGTVATASRTVAPGETLVLPNALSALWGSGDRAGTVRIGSASSLFIAARTYNNADPAGTFGLGVDAVPDEALLGVGQTGHVGWASESADGSRGFRTNVGVVLPVSGSSVDVVVLGPGGAELGRKTVSGGPLATQLGIREIASGDLSVARLELRVTAGKATGYTAVVDNVTGDGFTVQPQRVVPGSWADLTLNGASRGAGRFNAFFRTDARLVNPDPVARKVTVSGVSLRAGGLPFAGSGFVDVPARGVVEVTDVLSTVLHAPEGTSGSLRFETDGPLLVLGRTSNVLPDGATFGAVQRTSLAAEYLKVGGTGTFVGLLQSTAAPGFRTNIGFLSGPAGAVVDLTLRDRAGATVATRTGAVSLGAYGFTQPSLADLFPGTAIPENASLEVTATDGTLDVYASVIDNGTGDTVITPFARPFAVPPANLASVSPCAAKAGVAGGINPGTNLSRVDIDTSKYPEAVCNDGTPGLFYVRKGVGTSANRWLLFLEGGGSCLDGTSCANRWCSIDTNFGADKMSNRFAHPKGVGGGGILANRADNVFGDANVVWVYYCSSDSWVGRSGYLPQLDSGGRPYTIHFQGGRILDAVISELRTGLTYRDAATDQPVTLPSLDDAEGIVFAGESAGSVGVQRNADRLGPYFEATNRTGHLVFRAVLDAANAPENESFPTYEDSSRRAMRGLAAAYAARFDSSCLAFHAADSWRCDLAHLRANHITTPFFARQDLIDPNTTDTFGTPEWPFGTQLFQYAQATWDHLDALTRIRTTAEEKADILVTPGVYGPHCDNHTAIRNNEKFYVDKVSTGGTLLTYHDTLRNWLISASPSVVLEARPTSEPAPKSAVCSPN